MVIVRGRDDRQAESDEPPDTGPAEKEVEHKDAGGVVGMASGRDERRQKVESDTDKSGHEGPPEGSSSGYAKGENLVPCDYSPKSLTEGGFSAA
jgi:hypothetical protein